MPGAELLTTVLLAKSWVRSEQCRLLSCVAGDHLPATLDSDTINLWLDQSTPSNSVAHASS
jgi:hypothetical protein